MTACAMHAFGRIMTKASLIALTAFVWTAAFAGTGALVRIVNHPLPLPPAISEVHLTAAIAQAPQKPQPPPKVEERVITLPTVEIVGSPPPPVIKKEEPKPRELHCHEWRSLEQGSNAVQICD